MDKKEIIMIPDTQCKDEEDLSYMSWVGDYIVEKRPDYIVHIGDHYDFPSLSSYDKGTLSFEGRRLIKDIEAGNKGMELLLAPLKKLQRKQKKNKKKVYSPEMHFCCGNHEDRFDRLSKNMPELDGFVGIETLKLEEYGWNVHPFLRPVKIQGINFVHYLANPFSGRPYAGTAINQLNKVGESFCVGHKQLLDMAVRPTLSGNMQLGIVAGACYPFDEGYKGYQGNYHFRGIIVLHEARDGSALPMPVSLDYLKDRYYTKYNLTKKED